MYTIGLMSGTSIDAVDGVLIEFTANASPRRTLAFCSLPFPDELRESFERLQHRSEDELEIAARAAADLSRLYARVVAQLLAGASAAKAAISADAVAAIGAHGQTVRHRPELGYTIQLLDGALLAELTGIDVICDLRRADIAAGGQGAPLVPAFHAEVFGRADRRRAVVNIGGIANVSLLDGRGGVLGFDTGPGNTLMDSWCRRHVGAPFDDDGRWASSGRVDSALLAHLLAAPFFALPPPKSTGRDLFNPGWLQARCAELAPGQAQASSGQSRERRPEDVQATLLELTAGSVCAALIEADSEEIYLCGGGAQNASLVAAIRRRLDEAGNRASVQTTDALGVDPQAVEASAFAWLASRHLVGLPGNLPSVTGARGSRVLGLLAEPRPRD